MRENNVSFEIPEKSNEYLTIVQKTIYLLFNEGYFPTQRDEVIRIDFCFEAIRLAKILVENKSIKDKADSYALLALMQFNASRFMARIDSDNSIIEMERQDRSKWDIDLINSGIHNLNQAMKADQVSIYLILAAISSNHCIAKSFNQTNWAAILSLYDNLLEIEDSPTIRLNRAVALSKEKGNKKAIAELKMIELESDIREHPMFHTVLAEFYKEENELSKTVKHLKKAISLTQNKRDLNLLEKKLMTLVPIS